MRKIIRLAILGATISILLLSLMPSPVFAFWRSYAGGWWADARNYRYETMGVAADLHYYAGDLTPFTSHIAGFVHLLFPPAENGRNDIECGVLKRFLWFGMVRAYVVWHVDGDWHETDYDYLTQNSLHNYRIYHYNSSGVRWRAVFDYGTLKEFDIFDWVGGKIDACGEEYGDASGIYWAHFYNVKYYVYGQQWTKWNSLFEIEDDPYVVVQYQAHNYYAYGPV